VKNAFLFLSMAATLSGNAFGKYCFLTAPHGETAAVKLTCDGKAKNTYNRVANNLTPNPEDMQMSALIPLVEEEQQVRLKYFSSDEKYARYIFSDN